MAKRARVLGACGPGGIGPRPEHAHVAGVMIDIPTGGSYVVVAALGDGSTAMYMSAGEDITGAGARSDVLDANLQLLSAIEGHLGQFSSREDVTLPPAGAVRLHLLGDPT